jgi:hypothetical protein
VALLSSRRTRRARAARSQERSHRCRDEASACTAAPAADSFKRLRFDRGAGFRCGSSVHFANLFPFGPAKWHLTFSGSRRPESRPSGRRRAFHRLSWRLTTPPAVTSGRRPRRVNWLLSAVRGIPLLNSPVPTLDAPWLPRRELWMPHEASPGPRPRPILSVFCGRERTSPHSFGL